jgi:hypothetical protein
VTEVLFCSEEYFSFSFSQIVSEEKNSIESEEFKLIEKEFNVQKKSPKIPFIRADKTLLTVPLSSVAVWVDPLDATKEFTGLKMFYLEQVSFIGSTVCYKRYHLILEYEI